MEYSIVLYNGSYYAFERLLHSPSFCITEPFSIRYRGFKKYYAPEILSLTELNFNLIPLQSLV